MIEGNKKEKNKTKRMTTFSYGQLNWSVGPADAHFMECVPLIFERFQKKEKHFQYITILF